MKARLIACLIAATLAGCSSSEPSLPIVKAPHGGTLRTLPGGSGNVEVVRDDPTDKPGQTVITAYYYDAEMKPMSPTPGSASLRSRDRKVGTVALKPAGDALASDPFAANGGIDGELSATIGGKPVAVAISLR